jgi:hypothetical protein
MTVDDRLRAAHARIAPPDDATIAAARARLETAMTAAAPGRRRRRTPLRLVLPVAAVALALAAAVVLAPRDVERPAPRPGAPVATPLADVPELLAAGKVFYQRNTFQMTMRYIGADGRPTRSPRQAAYAVARSVPEEIWLAPDGSGRVLYGKESAPYLPSAADERAWRAAGAPDLATLVDPPGTWGPKKLEYGPGGFEAGRLTSSNLDAVLPEKDPLSVLPTDPDELRDFLHAASRRQRPDGPARLIRDTFGWDALTFLQYPGTPRTLRAALIEVLRTVPGTRTLGEITDAAGRKATALQLPDDMDGGPVLAYDPATSTLLARGARFADSVRWNMTYGVAAAAVTGVGERP